MRRRDIDITERSRARPETVFALLADGATWPRWSPIESFELERPGDPPPEGVGAIRVFRRGRTTGRDEIRALVPDRRLEYVSLSGLPVRDYRAEVELHDDGEGTVIHWHASFAPVVPGTGWILRLGLRRFLGQCARGLAQAASSAGGT